MSEKRHSYPARVEAASWFGGDNTPAQQKRRAAREIIDEFARKGFAEAEAQRAATKFFDVTLRFALTGSLRSDVTAGKFLKLIEQLRKHALAAFEQAWALNELLPSDFVVNNDPADFLTVSQRKIGEAAKRFLTRPEIEHFCSGNLIETLIAIRSACDLEILKLEEEGWCSTVPTAKGRSKTKQHGERKRFITSLGEIYGAISGRGPVANRPGGTRANAGERDPFTRFVQRAWGLADWTDPPDSDAIRGVLFSNLESEPS